MLYYPIPLLMHLHDHNIKMHDFDGKLEEWFIHADYNEKPEMLMSIFFGSYLKTPVPNDPEIMSFFSELKSEASHTLELPLILMPPDFVHDIKYDRIYDELIATPVEWSKVFEPQKMRVGQLELLTKLVASKSRVKILVASTGLGKTWVLLAYARATGMKTLIIEPEKGMESQLEYKYDVPIIMGMQHYMCRAEDVPANVSSCRILGKKSPCGKGCEWHDKVEKIRDSIYSHVPVAANPGNFWRWIDDVDLVIVDEYHKVFGQLAAQHSIPDGITDKTGAEWLMTEVHNLEEAISAMYEELRALKENGGIIDEELWKTYDDMQHDLQWKKLFLDNYDHVYVYSQYDRNYMKLDKQGTVNWFASLYPEKQILFVSATPLKINGADVIGTAHSVTSKVNAPIIYYPVGNLSANSISTHPEYLEAASSVIMDMYNHFRDNHTTKKVIVHSGNTGKHGEAVSQYLRKHGLKVMQHHKGSLMETIEAFKKEDYDALVVASADAGYDFYGDVFGLQFILKVPYPTLGDEWVAIENKHGKSYRWDLYANETISQIVQASGRICRGADDIGITMILDEKFATLYNQYMHKFPDSFKERLYDISGNLKNIAPSWQLDHYAVEQ